MKLKQHHPTELFLLFLLFAIFSMSSLFVVLSGIKIYKNILSNSETNYNSRASVTYLREKIHQHDKSGDIFITTSSEEGGETMLAIREKKDGIPYITYVYEYEHNLCELYIPEGDTLDLDSGNVLMHVKEFQIRQTSDSLYRLLCVDDSFQVHVLSVRTMSQ
jgi:hypothetical protein